MCEEIHRNSQLCEDILGVIGLPLEVAYSEQSSIIDEYMNKKYQQLENSKKNIQSEMNYANKSFDENIRQCTDIFKEEMNLILNRYNPNINDIQKIDQWLAASEGLNKLRKEINAVINEYYLDLKGLEQNRTEKIEQILHQYKEEAVQLRLCSPDETYKLLEEIIVEFNMNMLNNVHQHEDYKLQLQVEGQQLVDGFYQQLKTKAAYLAEISAQGLWKKIKDKQNHRLVIDTIVNLTRENLKAREDIFQATSHLVVGLSEFTEMLKIPSDFEIDENFWKHWTGMLNTKLESFESLCQRVQVLLKTAVTSILETFDDKINSLTRTLHPNVEILSESACPINGVANEIQILKDERAKELKLILGNWQEMIDALTRKINQSKVFVSDLTLIWTNHENRRNKLQADLEMELENQKRKWLKEESTINVKIKRQIKAIQEAKDLQKLNNSYKNLENTFSDLTGKWEKHYETQIEEVEAVRRNGIDPLIERKLSEIKEFLLVKYPKIQWFDNTFSLKLSNEGNLDEKIRMCNNYMGSVDNRTLGMYEMLERYLPACAYAIREESDDWLYVCIQEMIFNYETQVEEIKKRHETTLQTLKQVRSAELQIHSDRLLSHSSGIKSALSNLNKQYEETKLHINFQIADFNEKLQNIYTNKNNFNSSKHIEDSVLHTNHEWIKLCKSLEDHISEAKTFCFNEINSLNNSNSMFCQNAKAFKQGGNYSTEELKYMKKEINLLKKLILNHSKTLTNNYDMLGKSILSTVFDATIVELKDKQNKIKLEEDLTNSLHRIRLRLRTGASNLRTMGDDIEQNIAHISIDTDKWEDTVREIIAISKDRIDYLMFPSDLLTVECFSNINKTATSTIKASENENHNEIFRDIVEEVPSISKSYLGESKEFILNQFYDMVKQIQRVFKDDLPKNTKKDNRKNLQSTNQYDDETLSRINQLKTTLLNYYGECKAVCIQESQKHLEQTYRLQTIFNSFVKHQFYNVHQSYILNVNDLEKWYRKLVAQEHKLEELNRTKIKRNLVLPLAHPNQKDRLNKLFQEAKDACKMQNIRELLNNYKGRLQSTHDEYVERISSLRKNLESIQPLVFNTELSNTNLFEISALTNNSTEHETDCKIDETSSSFYPISIWSGIERDISKRENLKQPFTKRKFWEVRTDSQERRKVSIVELATKSLKESAELIQKLYDEAIHEVKHNKETKDRWIQLFEYDMNQAKLIHTKV